MTNKENLINKAIQFATMAHSNQTRKGTSIPFILHPLEVGAIITNMTRKDGQVDEVAVAAGYLHDTIEDAFVAYEMLVELFGKEVADLVQVQSEDKTKSWKERKDHMMEFLTENESEQAEISVLADKLSNMRDLNQEYKAVGEVVWSKFNASKDKQYWYYNSIAQLMKKVTNTPEYAEYVALIEDTFKN